MGSNPAFGVPEIGNMSEVGAGGNTQEAYETGSIIGAYLKDLGFNMDAAPDADVLTNPANEVVEIPFFRLRSGAGIPDGGGRAERAE